MFLCASVCHTTAPVRLYFYNQALLAARFLPPFEKSTTPRTFLAWVRWCGLQLGCAACRVTTFQFFNQNPLHAYLQRSSLPYFWASGTLQYSVLFNQCFWFYHRATRGLALGAGKPNHGQRTRTNRHSAHYTGAGLLAFLDYLNTTRAHFFHPPRERSDAGANRRVRVVLQPKKKKQILSKHSLVKKQAKDKLKKKIQKQKKSTWADVFNKCNPCVWLL